MNNSHTKTTSACSNASPEIIVPCIKLLDTFSILLENSFEADCNLFIRSFNEVNEWINNEVNEWIKRFQPTSRLVLYSPQDITQREVFNSTVVKDELYEIKSEPDGTILIIRISLEKTYNKLLTSIKKGFTPIENQLLHVLATIFRTKKNFIRRAMPNDNLPTSRNKSMSNDAKVVCQIAFQTVIGNEINCISSDFIERVRHEQGGFSPAW